MKTTMRKLFAPVSILICAAMIGSLFLRLQGVTQESPVIANPRFKYWTADPALKLMKPLMWEVYLLVGPNDRGFIRRDIVDGQTCLGLHAYQDGADDTYAWATVHVRQNLGGVATKRLLNGTLEVWVYPTFMHGRYTGSGHPKNVFGVEVNDGTNLLWIIFSDQPDDVYEIGRHRIVVINTPLNRWSHREVQIGKHYSEAGWPPPSHIALILLVGATKDYPGEYAGFFREIYVR
jgi:hypothetical protein